MQAASDSQEYERAARYRDTVRTIEKLGERQQMASAGLEDHDYLAHHREGEQAVLEMFQMRGGRIVGRREFGFDRVGEGEGEFLAAAVGQYYLEADPPPEIYVGARPVGVGVLETWLSERAGRRVRIKVPVRGVKRRFLELVRKNAEMAFQGRFRTGHVHGVEALDRLAEALGLEEPPYRIECFDVSNIQGTDSVASMVVWEGGRPRKSDYRTFSIRGIEGPDDFASIAEAVTRRYRRLLAEDRRLPDLVLIDGGAGQLGAAVRSLAAVGLPMMPVVGLAKREEEIHLDGGDQPVRLGRHDPALKLVQSIRDEAHRFAVMQHRRKRRKRTLKTELTEIPGIGPVTARRLLTAFGSAAGVRVASEERLIEAVGPKAGRAVRRHYHPEERS